VGEFLMILGITKYGIITAILAGSTIIFGAVYMLWMYQRVMFGKNSMEGKTANEFHFSEWMVMIIVCGTIFLMGIWPDIITKITNPAVEEILKQVQVIH
jgi:NADH-quinone oxidoreductase subunit M